MGGLSLGHAALGEQLRFPACPDRHLACDATAFVGVPAVAWKNRLVEIPEELVVNWPSLLFALVVDTLLVWAPAVAVFLLATDPWIPLAMLWLLAVLASNFALYARGVSLGTWLGGFRLRQRNRQPPGRKYGLVLTLISFASIPAIALMIFLSFDGGGAGDSTDLPGKANSYPVVGERIRRRRWLQGADAYSKRWS